MSGNRLTKVGFTLAISSLVLFFVALYFYDTFGVGLGFLAGSLWVSFRWILDEARIRKMEEDIRERRKRIRNELN